MISSWIYGLILKFAGWLGKKIAIKSGFKLLKGIIFRRKKL